jgi:hypothetical protein
VTAAGVQLRQFSVSARQQAVKQQIESTKVFFTYGMSDGLCYIVCRPQEKYGVRSADFHGTHKSEQQYVPVCHTEFYPNGTINVQVRTEIPLRP